MKAVTIARLALLAALLAGGALWLRAGTENASGSVPPTDVDVTGSWNVSFEGDFELLCQVEFVQTGSDLEGTYACKGIEDGEFAGEIKQAGDTVEFTLEAVVFGADLLTEGTVEPDGNAGSGTWAAGGFNGTFSATRKGVEATPTPQATSTATPPATNTPPGPVFTPTFTPTDDGTPTNTPAPASGDISCDGNVNSIDAALALQFGASLLSELPCAGNADVNLDGNVNSIDAALILQFVAGFLPGLPV